MSYTKSLLLILVYLFFCTFAFAGESSDTSTWKAPEFSAVQEYNFDFKAEADGGKINLSWSAFPEAKDFKWYKLAYSTTKENPSYPEDSSHFIGDKREQSSGEFWSKEKMLYVRLCAITHTNERFCSESRKVTLSQEIQNDETPKMCTMDYAPVCGKSLAKICMGPGCASVQKTYSNKCMMNAEKAKFLYEGECNIQDSEGETPKNTDTKMYKGDTKTCQLIKFTCDEGTQYFSDSTGCGCEKIMSSKVPEALKIQMKKVIDSFIVRLEAKGYSDEKNLKTIEQTIKKLEKLGKNAKYQDLSMYAITLLEQYAEKYQDDFSEIEKIFSDF